MAQRRAPGRAVARALDLDRDGALAGGVGGGGRLDDPGPDGLSLGRAQAQVRVTGQLDGVPEGRDDGPCAQADVLGAVGQVG